ncbi:MAG: gliding motility protein GldN [Prevotella sp.]|nr:gliding motility protein GldN [Prevotella sp.]
MRRILFIATLLCLAQMASAQPQTRRTQPKQSQKQQQTQQKSNADNMTTRAQISFPTQVSMKEDVDWRRDIYREINLLDDANAGLYYPKTVVGSQMNLFAYMFKLMLRGQLKAYEYRTDGNEVFNDSARVKPLQFLDDQGILYTRSDRGMRIDDSDIPSEEVTVYYVKESTYYDQRTATFHTKVQALCPIRVIDGGMEKRPLFWVKYEDLSPFLAKQTMMTSNLNNAATMSVDDFFTKNLYKGSIYKTNNMQGNMLGGNGMAMGGYDMAGEEYDDFGDPVTPLVSTDSLKIKAQQQIENQIQAFEKNMWGNQARKDSLDSIAKLDVKDKKALKRQKRTANAKTTATKSAKQRTTKTKTSKPSGTARMSVRRERH